MNMNKLLFWLLVMLTSSAVCADELSPLEQKREMLVVTTLAMDAMQTLDIKNHPTLYETNPLLGRHPSDVKVVAYFVGAGFGHYEVTKRLPKEYRAAWQYGWAALEIGTIIRNRKLNLRFNF